MGAAVGGVAARRALEVAGTAGAPAGADASGAASSTMEAAPCGEGAGGGVVGVGSGAGCRTLGRGRAGAFGPTPPPPQRTVLASSQVPAWNTAAAPVASLVTSTWDSRHAGEVPLVVGFGGDRGRRGFRIEAP
jgi:hypothetical protein